MGCEIITRELHLSDVPISLSAHRLPPSRSDRTRRIYDVLSSIYPASTFFFHKKAHRRALELSGLTDGMRVLEVATGSGEMFRRLAGANPHGETYGLDLSPRMAARTQRIARRKFPGVAAHCQAVDVRHMPFQSETFDRVFCCFLLELLPDEDILLTLREIRRVLKSGGVATLVMIGQNSRTFNRLYRMGGTLAPNFWGRQVESGVTGLLRVQRLRVEQDVRLRQSGYPSRVVVVRK
jgi:ubiquinone/menaquinone biosynthesis C-methylase UbiE